MYHQHSAHTTRPPSPRSSHVPLSIRTTIPPTKKVSVKQEDQSSSASQPPQPPYPTYPIPISPEKFPKALKLYNKYYLEKGLSQRVREPQSAIEANSRLNIPSLRKAHSLSSPGSPYAPSASDSAYDGVTETVVSFGEESPGSVTQHGGADLINYNGERVRQRFRRPLTPVSKAKAALIRHLKSCWVCQSRRVPCPLEHHDIASLENARQARTRTRAQSVTEPSRSSNTSSSSRPTRPLVADRSDIGSAQGQTTSLFGVGTGIGENDQFGQYSLFDQFPDVLSSNATPTTSQPAVQALESDLLSGIPIHRGAAGPANLAPEMSIMTYQDPYSQYQDGEMLALGVLRGFFYFCAHLDGLCHHPFEDTEALQTHFESHFPYTRIAPVDRLVCSNCGSFNNAPYGPCSNCGNDGRFQTWVYGKFIRQPAHQRSRVEGQSFQQNDSLIPVISGIEPYLENNDFGLGVMDDGSFNPGDMNHDSGYYNFLNDFGESGSQGEINGYQTPRSSGFPPGDWALPAKASPLPSRNFHPPSQVP